MLAAEHQRHSTVRSLKVLQIRSPSLNMGPPMNAMFGPDGHPATFNGEAWVSSDGKYWWNGAAWQPLGRRRGPNLFVVGMALLIAAAVGLVVTGVIRPGAGAPSPTPVVMGVTNPKIDSSTQIEFDYARTNNCTELDFQIVFYDRAGRSVAQVQTSFINDVTGGVTHHYVFKAAQGLPQGTIPSSAVRFVATPSCGGL